MDSGELCRVGSSSANVLVFAYPHYTVCSRVTLAQLQDFMVFTKEEMNIQPSTMDLDIAPFLYDNEELLAMGSPPSELQQAVRTRVPQLNGRYAWIRDPLRSWSWTENIWNTRLLHCVKGAVESRGLQICDAFNWSPSNYQDNLLSVFPELQRKELHITPFMGSTDLPILGREGVALIHISEEAEAISLEIGSVLCIEELKLETGEQVIVPSKLGELLASTYLFASLHHLNSNYHNMAHDPEWRAYGLLVIRGSGIIGIKMNLDNTRCKTTILFNKCSLKNLKDYLVYLIQAVQ
ncbi:hypothetical protein GBAR_LOCUS17452 [Geodia barretti]|nr:hypothetical protein GBAR_LOCUS17452 [Geodia barretti]